MFVCMYVCVYRCMYVSLYMSMNNFYIYISKNAQKTAQDLSGLTVLLDNYAQNLASKLAV